MAPRRRANRRFAAKSSEIPNGSALPHYTTLQTLISALQSPEGLKQPFMKKLYLHLVDLSLRTPMSSSNYESSSSCRHVEFDHCVLTVTYQEYVHKLSRVLFEQLHRSFEHFFTALYEVSGGQANQQDASPSDMRAIVVEITLLLRCCLVVLTLLQFDQELLTENVIVLLSKLRRIFSLALVRKNKRKSHIFEMPASSKNTYLDEVSATTIVADMYCPYICTVLEVLADELLMHKSLREYFVFVDSASSTSEKLFTGQTRCDDIVTVLEVISADFILSVSAHDAYEKFVNRLYWQQDKDYRVPELSLSSGLAFLLNPILFSAPKIFQAHFILLVCDAIGIGISSKSIKPDVRLMDCYLNAFELSVMLYTRNLSSWYMDCDPLDAKTFPKSSESYREQATTDFNDVIKSNNWSSCSFNTSFRTKSDLFKASIAYMEKNRRIVDELCEDEILPILLHVVFQASDKDTNHISLYGKKETSSQDIYLLSSLLKLMGSSLFQIIWCLRYRRNLHSDGSLKDGSSCKEHDFLMRTIGCFQQFEIRLQSQQFLHEIMGTHPRKHNESKWMFQHILGLLSLSFGSGVEFLVKSCIFMTIALLNLFILEEGDLDALKPLLGSKLNFFSSMLIYDQVQEVQVENKHSQKIASKFQKIQRLHMRTCHQDDQAEASENVSNRNHKEEERKVTCNGERFLNCVLESTKKISDVDDLAGFIECTKGKDYHKWLKDRQEYRQRKYQRQVKLRWEKKKKIWRYMKGR